MHLDLADLLFGRGAGVGANMVHKHRLTFEACKRADNLKPEVRMYWSPVNTNHIQECIRLNHKTRKKLHIDILFKM